MDDIRKFTSANVSYDNTNNNNMDKSLYKYWLLNRNIQKSDVNCFALKELHIQRPLVVVTIICT